MSKFNVGDIVVMVDSAFKDKSLNGKVFEVRPQSEMSGYWIDIDNRKVSVEYAHKGSQFFGDFILFEEEVKKAEQAKSPKKEDAVNSPSHYAVFEDIEAIEIIARSMTKEMFKGYCLGNLLKYRLRAGGKDDVMQELNKANKYKELYEKYKDICQ